MLKENGIAAESGIEKAQMKHAFEANEHTVMAITGVPRIITRLVA